MVLECLFTVAVVQMLWFNLSRLVKAIERNALKTLLVHHNTKYLSEKLF